MASTSETGHAKNSANFRKLIDFAIGFQQNYNPSKKPIHNRKARRKIRPSQLKLNSVASQNTLFNTAVNNRALLFKTNRPLATRIINALEASDVPELKIKDAKAFNRKLQGKRASKIETPLDPNTPAPLTISASQQSYDQQIQHFTGLHSILETEAGYDPNEEDLAETAIKSHINDMHRKNNDVSTAHVNVSNARLDRNRLLYDQENGLVKTAAGVKNYILSVFGANSPEYKLVSGLEFKTMK
ncbi:hypothetical protein [uncultured Flavobacterium sp.]|uniref:hypothetical protein n=1 Tax=uncultured Flavobacterium sp. TaxID=165435 RepID=UPI0025F4F400|nr:hypothetical protein [uncultured Flavobacterium sp.]